MKYPMLLLAVLFGCQKSLVVNGQNVAVNKGLSPAAGAGTAVTIPGGLDGKVSYYQTRQTVVVAVADGLIAPGDSWSVYDQKSKQTLLEAQSGQPNLIMLYPSDPANAGKFAYGANPLQLTTEEPGAKTAVTSIYLRDFRVWQPQASHFASEVQRLHGFQGEVSALRINVAKAGSQTLTTGFLSLVNH